MFFTFPGYGCSNGEYNDLAVLAFNPQGFKIQALFAAPHKTFHVSSLLLYSAMYYLLACITYGAFIPSGLFTVSLIFGGCFGRIWAEVLLMMGAIDGSEPGIVGMYALLGAGEARLNVVVADMSDCNLQPPRLIEWRLSLPPQCLWVVTGRAAGMAEPGRCAGVHSACHHWGCGV